jgi:hypothetical protein
VSFDPKVYELAEYYADGNVREFDKIALAQEIQDTVEAFLIATGALPQWMRWAEEPKPLVSWKRAAGGRA